MKVLTMAVLGMLTIFANGALGGEASNAMEVTPEMRQKMVLAHEQMAECLKSDKPMGECQKSMMKSCEDMGAAGHCPMMDKAHLKKSKAPKHRH